MAKSGDNFVTLDSFAAQRIPPLAYRFFCFSAHYRSPLAFSWEGLKGAAAGLANLRRSLSTGSPEKGAVEKNGATPEAAERMLEKFYSAVYDDLNMPQAMAALHEIVRDEKTAIALRRGAAAHADEILGLDLLQPVEEAAAESFPGEKGTTIRLLTGSPLADGRKQAIIEKVRQRQRARADKDWAMADSLRKELLQFGAAARDLPDGTVEVTL
jgi:cysteinyl-tRNA synthetase